LEELDFVHSYIVVGKYVDNYIEEYIVDIVAVVVDTEDNFDRVGVGS
jgi:hypothetical protein